MAKKTFIPDWVGRADSFPRISCEKNTDVFFPDWIADGDRNNRKTALLSRKIGNMAAGAETSDTLRRDVFPINSDEFPAKPLLIRDCRCILPGMGIHSLEMRIEAGKIQKIGHDLNPQGCAVIEANGNYVIPGVIDPHTHLGLFDSFASEVITESRSALLNGVTAMGVYLGGRQSYLAILEKAVKDIAEYSAADIFFHLAIFTREQLEEIPLYHSRFGINSFKAYMCGIPGLIPSLDEGLLLDIMEAVAKLGRDAVLNIHAENYHIVEWATERIRKQIPGDLPLEEWTDTHPGFSEAEAVQRAILLSEQMGVRIYFVHISSAESLQLIRNLKSQGKKFYVETTSPYLTLTDQTALGPLAKMVPPIRTEHDQQALWKGLEEDVIDTIGSDHTSLTTSEKKPSQRMWETLPGYPAVGTHLPSLLHTAQKKNFSLLKLVEKITLNPARIFGLYPRKGTLLPGSDADLVLIDLAHKKRVVPETSFSRSDFALHQGDDLIGWPLLVIKSGIPIYLDHLETQRVAAGRFLRRESV